MTEEKSNAEVKKSCCSDQSENAGCCSGGRGGCRCFKLAIAVILLIVGFWAGYITGRCGLGMKCGKQSLMPQCSMPNTTGVTPR